MGLGGVLGTWGYWEVLLGPVLKVSGTFCVDLYE